MFRSVRVVYFFVGPLVAAVGVAQAQTVNTAPIVLAQAFAPLPVTPRQLEQLAPPSLPALSPSLRPAVPDAQRGPGEAQRLAVSAVRIAGNVSVPESSLLPIVQPLAGTEVALSAIEEARIRLISAYGQAGFPFVTAVAGVSREASGVVVTFTLIEGRVGAVRLEGDIGPAGTQVLRFLNPLVGDVITARRLERALLLAGDIPGVTVRTVVRPLQGGAQGELELIAQVSRRAFSGYLSADNRGSRETGPVQALLNIGTNSFTEYGERIEGIIFQAQDSEQTFGQLGGEVFVGSSGLRVRAYAGVGRSTPGGNISALGFLGNSTVFGVGAVYPIIRSRPMNLFAVAGFDGLNSETEFGNSIPQSLDRVRTLRVGFEANALDTFLRFAPAPAMTTANVRLHRGTGWFGATSSDQFLPPSRLDSEFEFSKWSAELSRTQPLYAPTNETMLSVYGLVAGQRSGDVLPQTEKYLLGGQRLGRGYYVGQVTGDTAIGLSVELQLDVRPAPFQLNWFETPRQFSPAAQFYAFRDFGRTFENVSTDRDVTIESWGGGVRLFLTENVQLDIEGVRRMTRNVDAASGSGVRPLAETAGFFRVLTRF